MGSRINLARGVGIAAAIAGLFAVAPAMPQAAGQQAPAYRAPRTADGKPDLNGIWQAMNDANWDIEPHGAGPSPIPSMLGAMFAVPPGMGVVEGGSLPYKPEMLAKRK